MKRLATFCVTHRRRVVLTWIAILAVAIAASGSAGSEPSDDFKLPDSDSARALDLLEKSFPGQAGDSAQIVIHTSDGRITDPALKAPIEKLFAEIQKAPHVSGIVSPYQAPSQISKDGTIAFALVSFDKFSGDADFAIDDVKPIIDASAAASGDGIQVEPGGNAIENYRQTHTDQNTTEFIGLLAAIVILLFTFGSLIAMALPILTAIISLGTAIALVGLMTHLFDVADFSSQLAALIGLGVGIDYALFVLTRYRSALGEGLEVRAAVVQAMDTAGRAVMFAGATVVIALLGMFALGVSFLYGPAIASSLAVLLTMLAALTLLPALLATVGERIDRLRLPFTKPKPRVISDDSRWVRWSRFIERRPLVTGLAALGVLLALTIPVFSLDLGSADAGTDPADSSTRKAYDLLAEGFGAGFNGPLTIVAKTPEGEAGALKPVIADLSDRLRREPGVAAVEPARTNPAGDVAVFNVFPATSPQDQATEDLVKRIRSDVLPPVGGQTGATLHVAGITAIFADFSALLTDKLPLFIGIVVLLSALLLMAVFRSVAVPIKAVIMNLLSIGASFGVVVAIFQYGWLASVFGVDATAPIASFLPVMVFAIVFGLSMDYEVFLMSRMHEEWERTDNARDAVARGLAATGRVITAAAAIMVFVFASFALGDDITIKLFGIGLASAVLLDALIIRTVLVPSIMVLLDRRAWWLPGWLDRLLPKINVEPAQEPSTHSE